MTAKQLTETQIARWVRDMENQGVRVTRTKKGLLLRLPDGSTAMKHFTESDVRGPKNLAAVLRRAGVISPDDKKTPALPKYITEGTITQRSRDRIFQYIEAHDFPTMVFSRDVVDDLGLDPGSANRMLYHCGFQVGQSMGRKGRPWYTPEGLLAMKQKDDNNEVIPEHAKQLIDGARAAQAEIDALTAPKAEAVTEPEVEQVLGAAVEGAREAGRKVARGMLAMGMIPEPVVEKSSSQEEREFIDTEDSWTLNLDNKPLGMPLGDWLNVLESAGLDFEIRVWRKR